VTEAAIPLPSRLAAALESGLAGLFLTVGPDGRPHAAFSWVAAMPSARGRTAGQVGLRIAIDSPSTSLSNVATNARAAVQIIGSDNLLFLMKGTAKVTDTHAVPPGLSFAVVEMAVEDYKDQSWPLVSVSALRYEWTDARMADTERAVLRLLRGGRE